MMIDIETLRGQVQEVFRRVFGRSDLAIGESTIAADIAEWDSLTHINLIIALEQEFGVQFSSQDVASMSRVGDLFKLLQEKRSA